jgi:hypothetical protein
MTAPQDLTEERARTRHDRALELDARMKAIAASSARGVVDSALHLTELAEARLFEQLVASSIVSYAKAVLGYSATKTRDLIRIVRKSPPLTRAAFEAGTLPWTKARELVRIADADNERALLDEAQKLSVRELRTKVLKTLGKEPRRTLSIEVTAEERLDLDAFHELMRSRGFTTRGASLAEAARRMMAGAVAGVEGKSVVARYDHCTSCGGTTRETLNGPVPVPTEVATTPPASFEVVDPRTPALTPVTGSGVLLGPRLVRLVKTRPAMRCQVPWCTNHRWAQLSLEGVGTSGATQERIVALCRTHVRQRQNELLRVEIAPTGVEFFRCDGTSIGIPGREPFAASARPSATPAGESAPPDAGGAPRVPAAAPAHVPSGDSSSSSAA